MNLKSVLLPFISRVYEITFTQSHTSLVTEIIVLKTKIHSGCRYSLIETIDGKYGAKDKITGEWNGMVGMIVRRVG